MASSVLLIANPTARHGESERLLPEIERLLRDLPHDTVVTDCAGQATELAAGARGRELVVAVGGDGTANEVLNGLMRIPADERPALGLLPTGSGNDTRRTMGVPADLPQAAAALLGGRRRRFDVGMCNGIYFNNSFAAGLDAMVTAKAVEYKQTKRRAGLWLYVTALLHVLFRELRSFQVQVGYDSEPPAPLDTLIVAVTIGKTYGGGFFITPDAVADDGLFDVCTIDPLKLGQALLRLPLVIVGQHIGLRQVHMSRHASLVIESEQELPAQIDGEVLLDRRYELSILPSAIECVVPRGETS